MQEKLILDPQTSTNWYYYSFSKLCPGFHSSNNLFDLQKAYFCLCLSSQLEQINDHRNKWNIHLKAHMYLEYSRHIGQSKIQNPKIGVFQWILPKTAIVVQEETHTGFPFCQLSTILKRKPCVWFPPFNNGNPTLPF